MSDYLPFDLHVGIITRLPIKSLLQFRSVSKSWNSLILSPTFIARYTGPKPHLLVRCDNDAVDEEDEDVDEEDEEEEDEDVDEEDEDVDRAYVLIVDDDSFPTNQVSVHPLVKNLQLPTTTPYTIFSSNGLLCFEDMNLAVIWNPSVRKAVGVLVPNMSNDEIYMSTLGFGVCRETNDPKIVKVNYIDQWKNIESISSIPWQVEVFTLSTGAWRSPYSSVLPRKSIMFNGPRPCEVNGILYFVADDYTSEFDWYTLIISFDLTSEDFKEINIPESLARDRVDRHFLGLRNRRNSLVVLHFKEEEVLEDVWMMEDGAFKSFTKVLTICPPNVSVFGLLDFRKSGEPVMEVGYISGPPQDGLLLAYYEPDSKHVNNIEIDGKGSFWAFAHMETLLLLDQTDGFIYGNTAPAFEA